MQNTMSNGKEFPISAIVSAITGFILPHSNPLDDTNNMDEVAGVLSFLVGDDLYTHALVRAKGEVIPYVMEWYPQIAEIEIRLYGFKEEMLISNPVNRNVFFREKWESVKAEYGEKWTLWQIPQDDHEIKDPVQELIDMGFTGEIIDFNLSESEDDISPYGDLSSDIN